MSSIVNSAKRELNPPGSEFRRCEEGFIARMGISFRGAGLPVPKNLADKKK